MYQKQIVYKVCIESTHQYDKYHRPDEAEDEVVVRS